MVRKGFREDVEVKLGFGRSRKSIFPLEKNAKEETIKAYMRTDKGRHPTRIKVAVRRKQ